MTAVLTDAQRRERNTETIRTAYRLQEAHDLESWLALWADDATQEVPYAPPGFPREIVGKDSFAEIYGNLFKGFTAIHIQRLRIDPLLDPDRFLVRWHTHAPLVNGGLYENDLVGVYEFAEDGRIRRLTEYLNPLNINISAENDD
jgi:ketosteroid isomerase-like protein